MIPTIKTSPTLFAALTATALLVFHPSPASARTTLQLDNGNVLSFSDGSIDMVTGSGELFDVSVVEYGEEVARAEYVRIDATGNLGQADWFVNELVADNLEAVEEGILSAGPSFAISRWACWPWTTRLWITSSISPQEPACCSKT